MEPWLFFTRNIRDFAKQPFIIRKSDGASNYATTDLATLAYRTNEWESERIIYVTDGRQRDHFEQLFLTARKWYEAENKETPTLSHVWFGTILGEDNKAIKTRDGQPIKLVDLLNEAIRRAASMVKEKNPELATEEINRRAKNHWSGSSQVRRSLTGSNLGLCFSHGKNY